jgi:probable metal-binding protein
MNSIHGHEVLQMMLDSGKTYTKASLVHDIIQRFGGEARYHTCSAEDMAAGQLVEFLDSRGKLVLQDGGLQTSASLMCNHQE